MKAFLSRCQARAGSASEKFWELHTDPTVRSSLVVTVRTVPRKTNALYDRYEYGSVYLAWPGLHEKFYEFRTRKVHCKHHRYNQVNARSSSREYSSKAHQHRVSIHSKSHFLILCKRARAAFKVGAVASL